MIPGSERVRVYAMNKDGKHVRRAHSWNAERSERQGVELKKKKTNNNLFSNISTLQTQRVAG